MRHLFSLTLIAGLVISFVVAGFGDFAAAEAQDTVRRASNGWWLQEPVSEQARRVAALNWELLMIISVIVAFVFVLMVYTILRYRAQANPEASNTSHNAMLEFVWTGIPVAILVYIGFQSLPLLLWQEEIPETEFAIQVTGNQWNWTYIYPDHDGIEFTASVVPDEAFETTKVFDAAVKADYEAELTSFLGAPAKLNARLLDTDYRLVVPVNTKVKLLIAASDVIHSWTVPSMGVKMDAIPGRVNETWFEVDQTGTFYGQCSELCGKDHAFMPITVEAVSKEEFAAWVERAKALYATAPTSTALGR